MKRSIARIAREKGDKIVLATCAITAYALAFIPPYSTTDIGLIVLAAAPVLSASWLLGFWGGVAAALLSFPLNAYILNLTGQNGWAMLSGSGALQGSILVLVLGVLVGGLRDLMAQQKSEAEARRATEAARAETEARYRKLADSASDGIITMQPDLRIRYANPRAQVIFGREKGDLESSSLGMLFDPQQRGDDLSRVREYLDRVTAGDQQSALELTTHRPDGGAVATEVSFGESMQDGERLFTAIVRDVTERKEFERELHEARIEAIRANRAKSEFISRMSHELRTPLNSILGYAQLLDTAGLAEDDRDGMKQIVRAGRHLLALVDEVLDIARIEAGRLTLMLEPLDPADVTAQARDLIRPRADERGVRIDIDEPACDMLVLADQQRLRQVMLNLLSNAVKYNRNGGRVLVTCEEGLDNVRVVVEDEGSGVPADQVDRLFTAFDRLGAERSGVEGTGVGLSLTQHLLKAMGGDIGYERARSGGSRFWITLPRTTADATNGGPTDRTVLPNPR
jgi:PAS domain S-box-containing protein